jgi:hypothetical protein
MRVDWQPIRPLEILAWLKAHNEEAASADRPLVKDFVAVDDRPLVQEHGGDGLRGVSLPQPALPTPLPPFPSCLAAFCAQIAVPPHLRLQGVLFTRE